VKSLAVIELKMGKASDASKRFDEALSQSAGNAELLLWSAVAASASGDDAKAAKTIAEGLSAAGNDEIALYDLAETFLRRSALSVAANLYQRVNDTLPTETQFDHFSYLHLAAYYGFTGRDGEAAALLEAKKKSFEYAEVEILVPAEVEYLIEYYKGRAAVAAGEAKKGADILRDAAAKFPDGIVADGEIVKALEAAGDTKEADGVYYLVSRRLKDRMASSPEKHQAYYNFALFVASSGRKDEDGLRACEMALALAPLRPEYLGVQAALLSALGRDEDALVPVQRAMVLVSAPRWVEPFQFDEFTWLRLEILRKLGRPLPKAFTTLPAPATAPPE
jgi:tetratricopeptide (TPR) repeat protein